MSPGPFPPSPPPRRVVGIGSAVVAMVALVLGVGSLVTGDTEGPDHPPPLRTDDGARPIPAEAGAFRDRPLARAVSPSARRDSAAHARSLSLFRRLRAYPGAPPRIPHGLTAEEFRVTTCNNCHRKGGFVPRFGAYAPLTPHPELVACLQCHAPRNEVVGTPLPTTDPPDTCAQCHLDPDRRPPTFVASTWTTTSWPELGRSALPEGPLWIPHDLQLRGNCLACHAGPGAVREIRTDHPERESCRQCHVPVAGPEGSFPHPLGDPGAPLGAGTGPEEASAEARSTERASATGGGRP